MGLTIGIRKEDKNRWERRVPLIPQHLRDLQTRRDMRFLVESSTHRVFEDDAYRAAGIQVGEDLEAARLIMAVKEVPVDLLREGRIYVFFAHVIKGQRYNMPMLRRLLDLRCTLIDYERIVDDEGRRMIFFGVHAGYAGMIETLWCLGQRLHILGYPTPLVDTRHAYEYADLASAKEHLKAIGRKIQGEGLPADITPLVVGFSGYGNVSRGAQEVLDCLPVREVSVDELPDAAGEGKEGKPPLLAKVVFKEEHMVRPKQPGAVFKLQDYYEHPQRYEGCFERYLPHLDVLVNAIYWDERYPRLVTRQWAKSQYRPGSQARLKVIGDISCDIEGSIEVTVKATQPGNPCYVYDPVQDTVHDGLTGHGPVIISVDNLPCELPKESSEYFSTQLQPMIEHLAGADWEADFEQLVLPSYLKRAVIVHQGALTPPYNYLKEFLDA